MVIEEKAIGGRRSGGGRKEVVKFKVKVVGRMGGRERENNGYWTRRKRRLGG